MKVVNSFPFWSLLLGLALGGGIGALMGYFGQCSSGMCPLTATWWRGAIFGAIMGGLFVWSNATGTIFSARPREAASPGKRSTESWSDGR